ncbi:MAG TPA: FHA domain-containing protein, partial [Pirellulales bacterium]|nr:FHA domain-containing protein [Pirellulales bacterium]
MDQPGNNVSEQLWCSRGMIVTVRGPGDAEVSVRVPQPFARIGSDRYAEVCLPQGDLLPCNLYLHATANGIYCLGLSESAPNGWLTPHTRAEIGPYRIKAVFDDEGPAPSSELDDLRKKRLPSGAAPRLKIRDRSGNREVVELAINRPLTLVGRRTPSSLRMTHRTVSRVHCVLYWSGDSLWAIDLLSANGTLLDKSPIEAAPWSAGQKLILGDFRIHYAGTSDQHQSPPFPKLASMEAGATRSAGRRRGRAAKRREKVSASRSPAKSVRKPADTLAKPPGERQDSKVDTPQIESPADLPERVGPVNGDLAARKGNLVTTSDVQEQSSAREECTVISLSLRAPPSAPAEAAAEFDAPADAAPTDAPNKLADSEFAASESAIACRGQSLIHAETPVAAQPAPSDRETTDSERQLLEALRMLAACNPDLGAADGELPPALVQALLAMVQQAL